SSGSYITITSLECQPDGTEASGATNADEISTQVAFGESGSEVALQQPMVIDIPLNQGGGVVIESVRYVHLHSNLSGSSTYVVSAQLDGTVANGNVYARRVRHYAFRASSFGFV